uniref:Pyrin domain-containing protein n=1 Tax=Echeneis naucrates TaxID=173247 RepID=A0A665TIY3_ECHNA
PGVKSILNVLLELTDKEFDSFKFYLNVPDILVEHSIPQCYLDKASREETVNRIFQAYSHQSVEVVQKKLKKIHRFDLVEKLSEVENLFW